MITLHSIDLNMTKEPCYGLTIDGNCKVRVTTHNHCCTAKCPFYKPIDCRDWVRIEDHQGVHLIPPEEYFKKRQERK